MADIEKEKEEQRPPKHTMAEWERIAKTPGHPDYEYTQLASEYTNKELDAKLSREDRNRIRIIQEKKEPVQRATLPQYASGRKESPLVHVQHEKISSMGPSFTNESVVGDHMVPDLSQLSNEDMRDIFIRARLGHGFKSNDPEADRTLNKPILVLNDKAPEESLRRIFETPERSERILQRTVHSTTSKASENILAHEVIQEVSHPIFSLSFGHKHQTKRSEKRSSQRYRGIQKWNFNCADINMDICRHETLDCYCPVRVNPEFIEAVKAVLRSNPTGVTCDSFEGVIKEYGDSLAISCMLGLSFIHEESFKSDVELTDEEVQDRVVTAANYKYACVSGSTKASVTSDNATSESKKESDQRSDVSVIAGISLEDIRNPRQLVKHRHRTPTWRLIDVTKAVCFTELLPHALKENLQRALLPPLQSNQNVFLCLESTRCSCCADQQRDGHCSTTHSVDMYLSANHTRKGDKAPFVGSYENKSIFRIEPVERTRGPLRYGMKVRLWLADEDAGNERYLYRADLGGGYFDTFECEGKSERKQVFTLLDPKQPENVITNSKAHSRMEELPIGGIIYDGSTAYLENWQAMHAKEGFPLLTSGEHGFTWYKDKDLEHYDAGLEHHHCQAKAKYVGVDYDYKGALNNWCKWKIIYA